MHKTRARYLKTIWQNFLQQWTKDDKSITEQKDLMSKYMKMHPLSRITYNRTTNGNKSFKKQYGIMCKIHTLCRIVGLFTQQTSNISSRNHDGSTVVRSIIFRNPAGGIQNHSDINILVTELLVAHCREHRTIWNVEMLFWKIHLHVVKTRSVAISYIDKINYTITYTGTLFYFIWYFFNL